MFNLPFRVQYTNHR